MRLNLHSPWHWAWAAAVGALALLTFGEAHGQSTGSGATFEGRPAMSGAQAGEGAMAGPPQGGVAPQSRDDPRSGVEVWKPRRDNGDVRPADPGGIGTPGTGGEVRPRRDRDSGEVIRKPRDTNGLQDQGSTGRAAKRATKRTLERARRGVGGIDG